MGFAIALVLTSAAVVAALGATDHESSEDFPLWLTSLVNLPLQVTLVVVVVLTTSILGQGIVRDLALRMRWTDVPRGLAWGLGLQLFTGLAITYPVFRLFGRDLDEAGNAARELTDRADGPVAVIALVFTVAIMAPLSEELFYRGLLFGAFRKRANLANLPGVDTSGHRWNAWYAALANGVLFAIVHPDPWLWPALGFLGVVLARIVEKSGRLGLAIWTHVGFNTVTVVNLLLLD